MRKLNFGETTAKRVNRCMHAIHELFVIKKLLNYCNQSKRRGCSIYYTNLTIHYLLYKSILTV